MKKQNLSELIRGKGYYLLLFVGILAISLVAIIGIRMSSKDDKNIVDLNESNQNIAANEDNQIELAENKLTKDNTDYADVNQDIVQEVQKDTAVTDNNNSLLEFDVYAEEDDLSLAENQEEANEELEVKPDPVVKQETESIPVNKPKAVNLSFDADTELVWPVKGNVILPFSVDHSIYFSTLQLYKCNPAMAIDCEVGTDVLAAAKGVVTAINDDAETGLTVIMNIGDGYELTYGQLANVKLKVGDVVNKSDLIGTVNYPTKYYSIEGANLYLKMMKDGEPENPMLYLE